MPTSGTCSLCTLGCTSAICRWFLPSPGRNISTQPCQPPPSNPLQSGGISLRRELVERRIASNYAAKFFQQGEHGLAVLVGGCQSGSSNSSLSGSNSILPLSFQIKSSLMIIASAGSPFPALSLGRHRSHHFPVCSLLCLHEGHLQVLPQGI